MSGARSSSTPLSYLYAARSASRYAEKVAGRDARLVVVVHQPPRMEYDPKAKRLREMRA